VDLDGLNEAQRTAVTAADGAHLIVAGAGTGKTRTLVHRVAWLLEQRVAPRDIVLLTFTRRAATEMLDRVAQMVGGRAHGVRGGTFHGFALETLRQHADRIGFPKGFTILDRGDAESLVGLVRAEVGVGEGDRRAAKRGTLLNVISKAINTGRPIRELLEREYPQYAPDAAEFEAVAARYAERKRAQGVMDFDDLLVHMATLLRTDAEARRTISHGCRYVLVDEYQDTNRLQAQIACLLASVHGNLMVVGDEAQSIYAFRGAVVDNILDFPGLFPSCQVTLLEQSYRSVQPILDLANGVLASAVRGYDKRLRATREGGSRPLLVDVSDEHEQAEIVTRQVVALREQGIGLNRQAVLVRSAAHANLLEVALSEANVPYRKYGGLRFNEASHVKDVFALLRIVANPLDELAWLRVLQWFRGLGGKSAGGIVQMVVSSERRALDAAVYKKRPYYGALVDLQTFLERADQLRHDVSALMALAVAWYKPRLEDLYDDWRKRLKDLETMSLIAERYGALDQLLAELALDPPTSAEAQGSQHEDEHLTVSTIHSAKGLEWDTVYILQLADGAFPSGYSMDDEEDLEEERRLLYVAITRAERHLYLVQPGFIRSFRGPVHQPGCSLLDQVPGMRSLVDRARPGWQPVPVAPLDLADPEEEARLARLLGYFDR
jgi:DNA helicase-2/ATP-dependent DNA helicase PcrA